MRTQHWSVLMMRERKYKVLVVGLSIRSSFFRDFQAVVVRMRLRKSYSASCGRDEKWGSSLTNKGQRMEWRSYIDWLQFLTCDVTNGSNSFVYATEALGSNGSESLRFHADPLSLLAGGSENKTMTKGNGMGDHRYLRILQYGAGKCIMRRIP